MTPDPYRSAYEKALADLTSISERYEWLNTRKRHVENLISALQPVFSSDHQSAIENTSITAATALAAPQEISAAEDLTGIGEYQGVIRR